MWPVDDPEEDLSPSTTASSKFKLFSICAGCCSCTGFDVGEDISCEAEAFGEGSWCWLDIVDGLLVG